MDYSYSSAERIDYTTDEIREYADSEYLVRSYIETLLWSEHDDEDTNLVGHDVHPEAEAKIAEDVDNFITDHAELLVDYTRQLQTSPGIAMDRAMHDFVLTRNHHGAGFWDRGLVNGLGDKLTQVAQSFGEMHAYVGDDELVHVE